MESATLEQSLLRKCAYFLIALGAMNLAFMFASTADAKEVQIIEMRKNLTLKNDEKVQTDYFLNAGTELGIKPTTVFTLYRRLSVLDRFGGTQARPLSVPVGKIKIIYTAKNISVARLHSIEGSEKLPSLEYRSIMLGDLIHVGSAEADDSEGKKADTKEDSQASTGLQVLPEEMLQSNPEPQSERIELKATYFETPVENTQNQGRDPATSPLL